MKYKFFLVLFLVCTFLPGMEWPLPDAVVIQNFGLNNRGKPVLGTVFSGSGQIQAAGDGVVIFSRSEKETASRLPSPFGAWTTIDHGDGLLSIYARYNDNEIPGYMPEMELGSYVAQTGNSGFSRQEGLYFILYDRKERCWVNASMIIPPFPDNNMPQITRIQLRHSSGRVFEGIQLRNLIQGNYTIIVSTFDTISSPGSGQLAPHRIVCSVNGVEVGNLLFETIFARDGLTMVNRNTPVSAQRVYYSYPAYETGEVFLNRGQALLEVIVHDIAGNSRSSISRITVE